jgi:asparagine synthase (glutamine-hydrolysing)
VLRRYARSRLPAIVIDRPKLGFPVPVYGWLSGELSGWANDVLGSGAHVRNWLHDGAVDGFLRQGTNVEADSSARHRLWNVLILEHWACQWLN